MSEGNEMSGTHDCGGDAAAYVLGALDPSETEAFRKHLDQCAVCRDEVEAFGGVVQALPMAAPARSAPPQLRRRVMQAIREEPNARAARRRWPQVAGRWSGARIGLSAATATAIVIAAVLVAVGLSGGRGGGAGRLITARVAGITGSAQLRVANGRGELIVHRLSPPPRGKVYEVWLKTANAPPTPASVLFSVNSSGSADVGLPDSLRGASEVMVTAEPSGGSKVPTGSPVIVASLT